MPTYEYICRGCSHRFETRQKMTDDPLTICPECGGGIRRVLFPAGIVFKGSGFYKTDHNSSVTGENGNANENGNAKKNEKAESGKEVETKTASESKSSESSSETSSAKSSENKVPASTK